MTSWAERQEQADREWRMERANAEQVTCPWCLAEPGVTCVNSVTGEQMRKVPAHWQRLHAAEHGQELPGSTQLGDKT